MKITDRSGAALLVVVTITGIVVTAVILAALITARTEEAVRQANLAQRSFSDFERIKAVVRSAVADDFEVAPSPSATPYATQVANAVTSLQGGGNWGVVAMPTNPDFGRLAGFPANPTPAPLSDPSAIQDFVSPDVMRATAGSFAEWSAIGEFRFKRYDFAARDLVIQVRTLSFPLLRAPEYGPPSSQHRIAYWKASDARASSDETHVPYLDDGTNNRGIDEDVTQLTSFSASPLGSVGDAVDTGLVPFSFRVKQEVAIAAPGYVFSERGLRSYVTYCGVTHTYALDADLSSAPYGVPALSGVSSTGPKAASVDVAQLGSGHRIVGGVDYLFDRNAVLFSCESGGGALVISDSGGSTAPVVIVVIGSSDAAQPPVGVQIQGNITRPVIFILSRVNLAAAAGATDVNGALYLDADVGFASPDPLHVASLTYYGRTAVVKGLARIVADRSIPPEIEPYAPRAVVPLTKVL